MSFSVAAHNVRAFRAAFVALILAGMMLAAAIPAASPVRAAEAMPLKAVFIVGPTDAMTDSNLRDAEALAVVAEEYGMDVRRVFWPHATWENVLANIQGANLVVYMGHGYGWPSKYTKVITEARQNGMGLNTFDGSGKSQYTYYGAAMLKQYVTLAPNAIVFLNHLCYSAGNGEPGQAVPTWDVARQRVDNMANGWLASGAKTVFAYSSQLFTRTLRSLFTTDLTVEEIFKIPGSKPKSYFGWIGADARKFDSVRTPGATNFLDPEPVVGFYRAITGDLTLTGSQWAAGTGSDGAPTLSDFEAAAAGGGAALVAGTQPLITPNGDGVSDSLAMSYTVDKEAFVDFEVRNSSDAVMRTFSSWSPPGNGGATWDGKRDDGAWVGDGTYSVNATPRNRAGEAGATRTLSVKVLTTMTAPAASPAHFHPADGDALAQTTTMSVTLASPAVVSWKIVNANGDTVRNGFVNESLAAGPQSWIWDGRNGSGAYVPDGTYYSVVTAATAAGAYSHTLPVQVGAFRMTTAQPAPFVRGTKVKVFVYSAEPLAAKPKLKVFMPGLAVKTYYTYKSGSGWYVTVNFPATAQPGTATFRVVGKDANGVAQLTNFTFEIR